MFHQFWRKIHLYFAVFSGLFLLVAAVTGTILAFESISNQKSKYGASHYHDVELGDLLAKLQKNYPQTIALKKNDYGIIFATIITETGELEDIYIHPLTGKSCGGIPKNSKVFEIARGLHRSLFVGKIGRLCVGITAFCLFLIAASGLALFVKRQLGWSRFTRKIIAANWHQLGHIFVGRIALVFLVIISLTGSFLSLERFEILPQAETVNHNINWDRLTFTKRKPIENFKIFQSLHLDEFKILQFPFSSDSADYFQLTTDDKDLLINQFNSSIVSEFTFNKWRKYTILNYNLHTGKGNLIWSIILFLASSSILFFTYTGIKLTLKRKKGKWKNTISKSKATHVILVGSENGSTSFFAKTFFHCLKLAGHPVYIAEMNKYEAFPEMLYLFVMTSTFGNGEAPKNANLFLDLFSQVKQKKAFHAAILGFGSKSYPNFCQFAFDVDERLKKEMNIRFIHPVFTIAEESNTSFLYWLKAIQIGNDLTFCLPEKRDNSKNNSLNTYRVTAKNTSVIDGRETFVLHVKGKNYIKINSGDLLSVKPSKDEKPRFYSVGKTIQGQLLLSVRKHEQGVCSTYLSQLNPGDNFKATWIKNTAFNFPKSAKKVIAICNGTGIAPFLGMATENKKKIDFELIWGGKNSKVFELYADQVSKLNKKCKITNFEMALSREVSNKKVYVQDILRTKSEQLKIELNSEHTYVLLCGSLEMQSNIVDLLDEILKLKGLQNSQKLIESGRLKMDCYE